MCRYCKTLQDLRREDLRRFELLREKYMKWYKEDDMLLRRCLVALDWKTNQELVNDIFKQLDEV